MLETVFHSWIVLTVILKLSVNQINLHKLSSCVQNQKPCTINVNTIQRKGAVRIDVLLTREQVKILNDTG